MATTPRTGLPLLRGDTQAEVDFNLAMLAIDQFSFPYVEDRDRTSPPADPVEGQAHLVAASATGAWAGKSNQIAYLKNSAWTFIPPKVGFIVFVKAEECFVHYEYDHTLAQEQWTATLNFQGAVSVVGDVTADGLALNGTAALWIDNAVAASTTQTQGQGALTRTISVVTVCANANDTVTLPATSTKLNFCVVVNAGAQTLQVFPSSGGAIDGQSANASITIPSGRARMFFSVSANTWRTSTFADLGAFLTQSATNGITASTTQTQGQQALVSQINVVGTCANANDVVTLPAAVAGRSVEVFNRGAQTLQVFPASGGKIDGGSTDASVTIAAAKARRFSCAVANEWHSILSA